MSTIYRRADEVAHIAWELIQDHHPHLEPVRIEFVWRDKASDSKGKTVLAKARKVGGLNAFLGRLGKDGDHYEEFFVMEVAEDTWEALSDKQHIALVDHELCHFVLNDKGGLAITAHDVEEFVEIVLRHGLWKRDVAELIEAGKGIQRLQLEDEEGTLELNADDESDEPALENV